MGVLPQDIENIIISYKKDLEHAENKKSVIEQINQIYDWINSKKLNDLQTLRNLKMPLEFYGEFKLYIDTDSFEIIDTRCHQCKKEYHDIYFDGYVIMKKSKETIYGVFKGYDNQCLCEDGPVKEVLCKLDREHQVENGWQFLHYYVSNQKIVHKLIKILMKRYLSFLK
jgi:hypothetical protein